MNGDELHQSMVREPGPGKLQLNSDEVSWIRLKWKKIRTAQREADLQGNNWRRINDEINRYLDEGGVIDVVQRAKTKKESLALRDAFDAGNWHSAEATRHIADVDLFLQLKRAGVL